MEYIVDFYDSQQSYEHAKTFGKRNPWFVEMRFTSDPIVGTSTNLVITPDHYDNNPWYTDIPKEPYYIAEVKHEGSHHIVQIYYTGSEVLDFEELNTKI